VNYNLNYFNSNVLGQNEVMVEDSLNAPLLELKLYLNESLFLYPSESLYPSDTLLPKSNQDENNLIIYIDQKDQKNQTDQIRSYTFNLNHPLYRVENTYDEFRIKHEFNQFNESEMKAYVIRRIDKNGVKLLKSEIEEITTYIPLELFKGKNYIYTNYENCNLEITYPEDNLLNERYLSHASYEKHLQEYNEHIEEKLNNKIANMQMNEQKDFTANHLKVSCISSKDNNFSLTNDGKLTIENANVINNIRTNQLDTKNLLLDVNLIEVTSVFDGETIIKENKIYQDETRIGFKTLPQEIASNDQIDLTKMLFTMWSAIEKLTNEGGK